MAKKWTNTEYVKILSGFVNNTEYAKGCEDYSLTTDRIKKEASRSGSVGEWYKSKRKFEPYVTNEEYLLSKVGKTPYCADCIGFIKGPLMGNLPGKVNNNYDGDYDYSIKGLSEKCTDVKTDVTKGEVGEFMWTEDFSHCAIIKKKGKTDLESAPSLDGVKEVPLDYQPNWYACGKLPFVDYNPQPMPAPVPSTEIKAGDAVKIQNGAVYGGSSKGVKVPSAYCNTPFRVDRVQVVKDEKCALINKLNSWVPVRYLTKIDVKAAIAAGVKVKIVKGAKYGGLSSDRNKPVPAECIGKVYTVRSVAEHMGVSEALLREINSWVPVVYLTLAK